MIYIGNSNILLWWWLNVAGRGNGVCCCNAANKLAFVDINCGKEVRWRFAFIGDITRGGVVNDEPFPGINCGWTDGIPPNL